MKFQYVSQPNGKDHSSSLRSFIRINEIMPRPWMRALAWRFSNAYIKRLRLNQANEKAAFLRWGRDVKYTGNGKMMFHGSFSIGDNCYFSVYERGAVTIGNGVRLDTGAMLYAYEGYITLQSGVYIGPYSYIQSEGMLEIGSDTMIGPHVQILAYTRSALPNAGPYQDQAISTKGLRIGKNVWIGGGAIILDGVAIGDNAIIGAGAVVTRNVDPETVVGGVPARMLRTVK